MKIKRKEVTFKMMDAKEYRIIYLALLADYEKTNREIEMISVSVKRATEAGLDDLSANLNMRLIYLKQHDVDVSALIKKTFKLWKENEKGGK